MLFFLASFYTIKDYGISWDETIHFSRGQAYVYYFLTGQTNYNDLSNANLQGSMGKPENYSVPRRSFYQLDDFHNGEYYLSQDIGHPPLNDNLAALSNNIFFQRLGILGDIESHHLFNILASSLLVFVVVFFASETIGIFAGIVAGLSLVLYPLFWAESHFNIKDPPEAAFFAATIWAFYKSTQSYSKRWVLLSFTFFTLAVGTKFNALFIPLVVGGYLLFWNKFDLINIYKKFLVIPKGYLVTAAIGLMLSFVIFVGAWPYLWQDFPTNLFKIFGYYKDIGTVTKYQPDNFFIFGFNLFPALWIIYTTPPILLFLTIIGLITSFVKRTSFKGVLVLWAIWFLIPILRVTIPGTSIYGGDRQILEFLPAMSLLGGLGAWQIARWVKGKFNNIMITRLSMVFILLLFLWPLYLLVKMHPNQNVYFNSLIGGLKGAQENNFPSWGNSFGNAYYQGIKWINENVEYGSKLSLIQGTRLNLPPILIRKDIDFSGMNWSGIERRGEYLIDLTFNDTTREFHYAWNYMDSFLIPVYEVKVDGVPILKIWKNDLEHTKESMKKSEVEFTGLVKTIKEGSQITLDLGSTVSLSRLYLYFESLSGCTDPKASYVELSMDQSKWIREKDPIPFRQVEQRENIDKNSIEYVVAGKNARYIKFVFDNTNSCPLNYKSSNVLVLE